MPSRVRELRARIGPRAGQDAVGRAEPVAERVEVMDAHDERGQRGQLLAPRHPVRDGPHVDGGQHRLAEPAALQHVLHGAHRLVVAHVLVDGQRDAGLRAQLDARRCASATRHAPAASGRGCRGCGRCARRPGGSRPAARRAARRCRAPRPSGRRAARRASHDTAAMPCCCGDGAGVLGIARGDGDRIEARLAIGDQVAIAHDEAGADAADAPVLARGKRGR